MATIKCIKCGSINEDQNRFCNHCGSQLTGMPLVRNDATPTPTRRAKGPPAILIAILLVALGFVAVNQYTDLKPVDFIMSLINGENAPMVQGRYECHLAPKDLDGGVMRTAQTWAYTFFADGRYTTYLEGSQQFSGTWSQTGKMLTVNVPAIKNLSDAYSFTAIVSADGNSFIAGDEKYIKVSSQ
jgi:hypothetical protein